MSSRAPNPASLSNRPRLDRLLRIHQAILSGSFPNATRLAAELEVSVKSIQRDLAFMRDRMELPLEYNSERWGYYYSQEVGAFPYVQITEGELFALLVAEKALQQYQGTSFEKPLVSAFNKMAQSMPETISVNLSDWDKTVSFHTSAEPIIKPDVFEVLSKGAKRREQLQLTYRKPGQKNAEPRLVDPYQIANINGEWYLFAYCHLRQDIRTFALARILAAEGQGKKFERPKRFSLAKRLENSFGVLSGRGDFHVRIRFEEMAADYIREKKWHPSQRIIERSNGQIDLELKLSSLQEVQRWILSWGGQAKVLAPPELAASVRQAARKILGQDEPKEPAAF